MALPLIGRLQVLEWPPLIFGMLLVMLESFLRFVTSLLPGVVIGLFEKVTRKLYSVLAPGSVREKTIVHEIHDANGFVEICALFGYSVEEHIVKTTDGYLLGVHRIYQTKTETKAGTRPQGKPVVYLHHGLLMNSEIWVSITEEARCLPFMLVERGYDVWLGNNRGNKYSKKHVLHSSIDTAFWNFSMDEFALYDIPDTIDYILHTTRQKHLAYLGFSQGSAQAFAALSLHPKLNDKVNVFVALAPAMAPGGLHNSVVDSLIKASPTIMYLFFGRRAILSSAIFWQSIMYPPLFVRLIDRSLIFLFNWHGHNISFQQKIAAYAHLYSFTSVKTVVHWFQIMRRGCFQMFDDDVTSAIRLYGNAFYHVAQFPTRNIRSPIYLVYGTEDSLVDIDAMLSELPKHAVAIPVIGHEHLDIVWGRDVEKEVLPHVFHILEKTMHAPYKSKPIANSKMLLTKAVTEDSEKSSEASYLTDDVTVIANQQENVNRADQDEEKQDSDEESLKTMKHSAHSHSPSPPPDIITNHSPALPVICSFSKEGILFSSSEPLTGMSGPALTSTTTTASARARASSMSSNISAASIMAAVQPASGGGLTSSPLSKTASSGAAGGHESISTTFKKKGRKLFGLEGSGNVSE
ncbi:alpha/beta-hydrolase [Lipomyces arxii]|uniref:alpha/beta-hydrolase n=1 Tax=Lipomyces arxii TaxID=56418 RepID=UPI0034CE6403